MVRQKIQKCREETWKVKWNNKYSSTVNSSGIKFLFLYLCVCLCVRVCLCLCRAAGLQVQGQHRLPDQCGGGPLHGQQPGHPQDVLPAGRSLHVANTQLQHSVVEQSSSRALSGQQQRPTDRISLVEYLFAITLSIGLGLFFHEGLNHLPIFTTSTKDATVAWRTLGR